MRKIYVRIPALLKNFYVLASLFFLTWLLFIDSNDLLLQSSLIQKEKKLKQTKEFYEEQILEIKNQHEALANNPKLLEKLAREKYLMKKKDEDLYILVEK
ncbi:MAG: septum formation initiator family protein [Bacteroidota bacterium]